MHAFHRETEKIPVCVFTKPSRPGEVKTRLIPIAGAEGAAALAEAFFEDTWEMVRSRPWALPVIAATEPMAARESTGSPEVWIQGEGDLGARLERILQQGIARSGCAIALGADSPGLAPELLEQSRAALRTSDGVLGPCSDGGFYLLGLRTCPDGLLSGIPWSQPVTLARTLQKLEQAGLAFVLLDEWFDVDRPEDLARLYALIAAGTVRAPRTARLLQESAFRPIFDAPRGRL